MRKILSLMILTILLFFVATPEKVFAADIWVAKEGEFDVYIMTDTIVHKKESGWEGIWVVSKKVRNGQTESTTKWTFDVRNHRYETSSMRGDRTERIYEGSLAEKIFNKCLQYI